jgi:hypothetical protein
MGAELTQWRSTPPKPLDIELLLGFGGKHCFKNIGEAAILKSIEKLYVVPIYLLIRIAFIV